MVPRRMLIGLMADIHGNLAALEAVLRQAPPLDAWLCAGDLVGYYPDVNEVCQRVRQLGVRCVRGNHDAYVTGALAADEQKRPLYKTDWTRETLDPANLAWLSQLPVEMDFSFAGCRVRLRHASPWDEETYLYPDSPELERIALERGEVLVLGHTHHPLARPRSEGLLVNPGSVGQPRDYDPRAAYAVLDTASGEVYQHRAAYDVAAVQARLRGLGWPEAMIAILSRRRQDAQGAGKP